MAYPAAPITLPAGEPPGCCPSPCVDCAGPQPNLEISGLTGPCSVANGSWPFVSAQVFPGFCVWSWNVGGGLGTVNLVYYPGSDTWQLAFPVGPPAVPITVTCSGGVLTATATGVDLGCGPTGVFSFNYTPVDPCDYPCYGAGTATVTGHPNSAANGAYTLTGAGACTWQWQKGGTYYLGFTYYESLPFPGNYAIVLQPNICLVFMVTSGSISCAGGKLAGTLNGDWQDNFSNVCASGSITFT